MATLRLTGRQARWLSDSLGRNGGFEPTTMALQADKPYGDLTITIYEPGEVSCFTVPGNLEDPVVHH